MRFTINRGALARVVTNVGRVVASRNTAPILGMLKLVADSRGLLVAGTDMDIEATDRAEADVQQQGAVCVDAKLLADIAKKAGADDVTLNLDGDRLVVKSGRSQFKLQTLSAEDFPTMNDDAYDASFQIDLAAMFAPVSFAISTEETRYYLNGVFLHTDGGKLIAVATDGHRLARHAVDCDAEFAGIIVPRKMVGIVPKGTGLVSVSANKIRFEIGDFTLVSALIDGTFPAYERVIPFSNARAVTVDRDALMKAADRVATISTERGRAVRMTVAPGGIQLVVRSADAGEAEDEVPAEFSGEPLSIGFNAAYLRDVMSGLPAGPVELALADGGSPALIKSPAAPDWLGVLMPVRIT